MNLLLACKCLIFQPIYLGLSKQAKQASKNITELDFQWPLSSRTLTNMVTWERMLVLVPIALLADFSPRYTLTVKQWLKQVDCCAQPNSFFFFLLYRPYSALTLVALQNLTSVTLLSLSVSPL